MAMTWSSPISQFLAGGGCDLDLSKGDLGHDDCDDDGGGDVDGDGDVDGGGDGDGYGDVDGGGDGDGATNDGEKHNDGQHQG